MAFKIYTKTGDKGKTSLLGGVRVPKYHLRIESYGTLDELNSWMGLLADLALNESSKSDIVAIQNELFVVGSYLAMESTETKFKLPAFNQALVGNLEKGIDSMESELEPLKQFILPGGHTHVSQIHITRCVCRRAERLVAHLAAEETIPENIIIFLNRLSDYLFVLSRHTAHLLQVKEVPWNP